jgi:hypothetical protein
MIINDAGDLLEAAALEIEERGWTRGDFKDKETSRVCVIGALQIAALYATKEQAIFAVQMMENVCQITPDSMRITEWRVVAWNDFICESQEQAVEMVRQSAKLAREVEST